MNRVALAVLLLVAAPALAQSPPGYQGGYPPPPTGQPDPVYPKGYPPPSPDYPPAPIDSGDAPPYGDELPPRWAQPPMAPTAPRPQPIYPEAPQQAQEPQQQDDDEPPPPPPAAQIECAPVELCRPGSPSLAPVSGALLELSAGPSARSLYGAAIGGVDLGLHVGGEGPRGAWMITTTLLAGATDHRLPVEQVQWGFAAAGKIGRLRLGGGGQFGVLVVHRITSGDAMATPTVGIYGTASIDLGSAGARVMPFLSLRLGVDALPIDSTAIFDGTLALGLRM